MNPSDPDLTRSAVEALEAVRDPRSGQSLGRAGYLADLSIADGVATLVMEVPPGEAAVFESLRVEAETALAAVPGVRRARVVMTAATPAPAPAKPGRAVLSSEAVEQGRKSAPVPTARPDHVRAVIAVASGKGGVGKSTVATNLACAFAAIGMRVGLLDADVHGPSVPLMLGLAGAPDYVDGKMAPHRAWGVAAMSVGLLTEREDAMIWRGPMASQALTQMLTQTRWGTAQAPLDVLVVDMPPGTGDVQLTLVQKTPLDGVVIVSTPQEAALADARRAVTLFGKTGTPVLGLIENMSGPVFGEGGAEAEADRLGIPFLGSLPLDPALRIAGDAGRPLIDGAPETEAGGVLLATAETLARRLRGQPGSTTTAVP